MKGGAGALPWVRRLASNPRLGDLTPYAVSMPQLCAIFAVDTAGQNRTFAIQRNDLLQSPEQHLSSSTYLD